MVEVGPLKVYNVNIITVKLENKEDPLQVQRFRFPSNNDLKAGLSAMNEFLSDRMGIKLKLASSFNFQAIVPEAFFEAHEREWVHENDAQFVKNELQRGCHKTNMLNFYLFAFTRFSQGHGWRSPDIKEDFEKFKTLHYLGANFLGFREDINDDPDIFRHF